LFSDEISRIGLTQKFHFDSGAAASTECRLAIRTCVASEAGLRAQLSVSTGLNGTAERIKALQLRRSLSEAALALRLQSPLACGPFRNDELQKVLINKRTRCFHDGYFFLFSSRRVRGLWAAAGEAQAL
jgi:hypothetical protein